MIRYAEPADSECRNCGQLIYCIQSVFDGKMIWRHRATGHGQCPRPVVDNTVKGW